MSYGLGEISKPFGDTLTIMNQRDILMFTVTHGKPDHPSHIHGTGFIRLNKLKLHGVDYSSIDFSSNNLLNRFQRDIIIKAQGVWLYLEGNTTGEGETDYYIRQGNKG